MGRLDSAKSRRIKMQKIGIKFFRILPRTIVGLGLAVGLTSNAYAAFDCTSKEDCTSRLLVGSGYCCCRQKTTGTTYNCPSGWTWSSTQSLCTRTSTSGTDSAGTYTQSYGTCSYTSTSTYDCYLQSTSTTDAYGDACLCTTSL